MQRMILITAMNMQDIDLNLLRIYDAVLRRRNVTAAAAELGLTQSAVSNALARLRRLLGDTLFVRTPQGMQPTAYARQLAEPVRQALSLVEAALAVRAQFDPATSTRRLRFYMSDIGEIFFLPPLVEHVRRTAPGIGLEAVPVALDEIPAALASGELDLAVGFLPHWPAPLRRKRLFRDPYRCVMRADHPTIGKTLTRSLFLQAAHALVPSRGSGHGVVEETFERTGLTRNIALRVPHFTVVPTVLEGTDLLLTVPGRVARVFEKHGNLKSLKPPVAIPPADVGIQWHERFDADPGNRWFRELMIELFGE